MKLPLTLLLLSASLAFTETLNLGNLRQTKWSGLEVLQAPYPVKLPPALPPGTPLGRWANLPRNTTLNAPMLTHDYSNYTHVSFWLYSSKANHQHLTFFFSSENDKQPGMDYYFYHMTVAWEGWRHIVWSLAGDIGTSRFPKGWNTISDIRIHATGWNNQPLKDTTLYLADFRFISQGTTLKRSGKPIIKDNPFTTTYTVDINNTGKTPVTGSLKVIHADPGLIVSNLPHVPLTIQPQQKQTLPITLSLAEGTTLKHLEQRSLQLEFISPETPYVTNSLTLDVQKPLPQRQHPCLFTTQADITRCKERASRFPWAKDHLQTILETAAEALTRPLDIPTMEGQWSHHYVCKVCGIGLKYTQTKQHICPKCGKEYTGWPYDQVRAGFKHGDNWQLVKLFGQAYAFTGNEAYAQRARDILLGYVERYPQFTYHNVYNTPGNSGGRMLAQTLDEAVAIIAVCWGYDLVYNSPCFTAADHAAIEDIFLREVAVTIRRNDSGISNWQTWHNAGVAAIGFCLNDAELIKHALFGKSGLAFQLDHSILPDGFWYEGTGSYHFYALDALKWTVEAALHAGFDFTRDKRLISLFDAPLSYVTPGLTFPAINDGDVFDLKTMHSYYEWAYGRIGKPDYLTIAQYGRRGDMPFFFGADTLPEASNISLKSRDFSGLGAVVLRQGDRYIHFDYGPHGGGHGHPDKLTTNIYAAGHLQAPDPGRLAYGAPMQGSWYRQTVAHNTVTIDGKSQNATTGQLLHFIENGHYCLAQAMSDKAYPGTTMVRTVGMCDGVIFDIYELESDTAHTYDWLFHNFGIWTPKITGTLAVTDKQPGTTAGYQHITNLMSAIDDNDWYVDIVNQDSAAILLMNGEPGTELFFGEGIANNPPTPCPLVIVRRHGKTARFISCIDYRSYGTSPREISIRLLDNYQTTAPAFELIIGEQKHIIAIQKP